jgi:hypothetical protein
MQNEPVSHTKQTSVDGRPIQKPGRKRRLASVEEKTQQARQRSQTAETRSRCSSSRQRRRRSTNTEGSSWPQARARSAARGVHVSRERPGDVVAASGAVQCSLIGCRGHREARDGRTWSRASCPPVWHSSGLRALLGVAAISHSPGARCCPQQRLTSRHEPRCETFAAPTTTGSESARQCRTRRSVLGAARARQTVEGHIEWSGHSLAEPGSGAGPRRCAPPVSAPLGGVQIQDHSGAEACALPSSRCTLAGCDRPHHCARTAGANAITHVKEPRPPPSRGGRWNAQTRGWTDLSANRRRRAERRVPAHLPRHDRSRGSARQHRPGERRP